MTRALFASSLGITRARSNDDLPRPDCAYKIVTRPDSVRSQRICASRLRPKRRLLSWRSKGRSPIYGSSPSGRTCATVAACAIGVLLSGRLRPSRRTSELVRVHANEVGVQAFPRKLLHLGVRRPDGERRGLAALAPRRLKNHHHQAVMPGFHRVTEEQERRAPEAGPERIRNAGLI